MIVAKKCPACSHVAKQDIYIATCPACGAAYNPNITPAPAKPSAEPIADLARKNNKPAERRVPFVLYLLALVIFFVALPILTSINPVSGDAIANLLMVALALLVGYVIFTNKSASRVKFCRACGITGVPVTHTKGSILIEIILWLCFLVPGLIYTFWRHTSRAKVCASCNSTELLPPDSPMAKSIQKQLEAGT